MNGRRIRRSGLSLGWRSAVLAVVLATVGSMTAQGAVIRGDELALGSVVFDSSWLWNGEVVEWRVVHNDYSGAPAGSVTLMATESIAARQLNSGWNNRWSESTMRDYLNADFYDEFSTIFKSIVQETDVSWAISDPQTPPGSGVTTDRVFLASRTELGGTELAGDGQLLDWFDHADAADRRADVSGPANYWTRTGESRVYDSVTYDLSAYYVSTTTGAFSTGAWVTDALGTVPVINIRGDAEFIAHESGSFQLIPEPGTIGLLLGAGGLVAVLRRRRKRSV